MTDVGAADFATDANLRLFVSAKNSVLIGNR